MKWFSPKESLPADGERVLIAYKRGRDARIAYYKNKLWLDTYSPDLHGLYPLYEPTLWSRIPDPWENIE